MRKMLAGLLALTLAGVGPYAARADDPALERAREMLHRTQEALRQAQAENTELKSAKADAERKLQEASKQIDAAKTTAVQKAAQQGLRAKLQTAQDAQADLKQKVAAANAELAAMSEKQRLTAQLLANRDAELTQTKQLLEQSKAANVSCEDKNGKLYIYGQEMLQRYENKGVWAALSQKEPVLGLKEVEVENVVQEYKLKMAGQKIK